MEHVSGHISLQRTVRRRKVFYIPGYDPNPPRRYRELYRKQAAKQAKISSYSIDVKAENTLQNFGWKVDAHIDDTEIEASFEVLVWSDIVRASMSDGIAATYMQMIRTAWAYIGSGALRRLARLRKGPVIAALYPVVVLMLQFFAAIAVGALAGSLASWAFELVAGLIASGVNATGLFAAFTVETSAFVAALAGAIKLATLLVIALQTLEFFRRHDNKIFVYYLMHDYAFSAQSGGANPPELDARMDEFRSQIAAALSQNWDEVLVVGHSSGAHLAISILADLIRDGKAPRSRPALGFLSLGQVVPMMSFLPKADKLRADLCFLSTRSELAWIDVTAPGDGCSFALCDPVCVSGVEPEGKKWPLVFSAAFTQSLSPERWSQLKRRYFRLHFQYLCAFDRPKDYDYFQITAGPLTLADRFKDRPPSRSRIDVAASGYTSIAA